MSPRLLHCTVLASSFYHVVGGAFEPSTLTALKELRLGKRSLSVPALNNATIVLRYITLPALERLHIHCSITRDTVSDFSAFILRSSPPLRCLVFDASVYVVEAPTAECLYAVPTLETLTLSTSDLVSVLELLATDSALLPNLEHLTCTPKRSRWRGDFEVVVRILQVRSLSMFRLNITTIGAFGGADVPNEDILVELRRIRSSGVDIYIGDEQRNLWSCHTVSGPPSFRVILRVPSRLPQSDHRYHDDFIVFYIFASCFHVAPLIRREWLGFLAAPNYPLLYNFLKRGHVLHLAERYTRTDPLLSRIGRLPLLQSSQALAFFLPCSAWGALLLADHDHDNTARPATHMESVTELHELIDELSFAIDVQLEALESLEKRRSDARRALNSKLDPVARFVQASGS
ncbi:hypothetical protein R3P38DRAFT_3453364 [Favolaschia claudopus]|uniref:F-box protein n=1 Tax=Favolaschia claudopus TaxID=2862362 RepID=A0AAW0CSG1_9AGAR